MSDFSFSSTAECELCGAYLSSSDEDCDHNGQDVAKHVFRRIASGRESMVGVKCCRTMAWDKLKEKVGDDWIGYEYLGTKEYVNENLSAGTWDSVSDMPRQAMALSARIE